MQRLIVSLFILFPAIASVLLFSSIHSRISTVKIKSPVFSLGVTLFSSWLFQLTFLGWAMVANLSLHSSVVLFLIVNTVVLLVLRQKYNFQHFNKEILQSTLKSYKSVVFVSLPIIFSSALVVKKGEFSWDGHSQHLPVSQLLIQNNGIYDWETITPFQYYPGTTELYGSLLAIAFGSFTWASLAQLIPTVSVILIGVGFVSNKSPRLTIPFALILATSSTLIFGASHLYTDVSSSASILILLVSIYYFLLEKNNIWLIFISIGVAGIAQTKIAGLFQLTAITASVLVYIFCRDFRKSRKLLENLTRFILSITFGFIVGAFWFLRNLIEFSNPFYPGPGVWKFNDGIFSKNYIDGMFEASKDPVLLGHGIVFINLWNFVLSIPKYFYGLAVQIKNAISGTFEEKYLYDTFVHDARNAGLGGFFQIIFLVALFLLAKSQFHHLSGVESVLVFSVVLGVLITPGNSALRYFLGSAVFISALGFPILFKSLRGNRNEKIFKIVVSFFVFTNIFGSLLWIKFESTIKTDIHAVSNWGSVWFQSNKGELLSKCRKIGIAGFPGDFPSALWGSNPCNKVTILKFSAGGVTNQLNQVDYVATVSNLISTPSSSNPNSQACLELYEKYPQIYPRWGTPNSRYTLFSREEFEASQIEKCSTESLDGTWWGSNEPSKFGYEK